MKQGDGAFAPSPTAFAAMTCSSANHWPECPGSSYGKHQRVVVRFGGVSVLASRLVGSLAPPKLTSTRKRIHFPFYFGHWPSAFEHRMSGLQPVQFWGRTACFNSVCVNSQDLPPIHGRRQPPHLTCHNAPVSHKIWNACRWSRLRTDLPVAIGIRIAGRRCVYGIIG